MKKLELKNKVEVNYVKEALMQYTENHMLEAMNPPYIEFIKKVVELDHSYSGDGTTLHEIAKQRDNILIHKWAKLAKENQLRVGA